MNATSLRHIFSLILFLTLFSHCTLPAQEAAWHYVGCPDGGGITGFAVLSTGEIFATTLQRGVFRSLDDGTSWERTDAPIDADARTICGGGRRPICLVSNSTLYKSTDRGEHWVKTVVGGMGALISDSNGMFFAGTWNGLLRSDDGYGWVGVSPVDVPPHTSFHLAAGTGGHIYAAGTSDSNWLIRSTDGGWSWSTVPAVGLPSSTIMTLAAAPDNTLYISAARNELLRSTDDGNSWTSTGVNATLSSLSTTAQGSVVVGVTDGVMISTDRGVSWSKHQSTNSDILTRAVGTLTGRLLAGFSATGVFSFDGDGPWRRSSSGLAANTVLAISTGLDGSIYAVTGNDRVSDIQRSTDGGKSWSNLNLDAAGLVAPVLTTGTGAVLALSFDLPRQRVNRSTDGGATWRHPTSNLSGLLSPLFLTSDGSVYASITGEGIMRSTDDGGSWTTLVATGGDTAITGAALVGGNVFLTFKHDLANQRRDGGMLVPLHAGGVGASGDFDGLLVDQLLQTEQRTLIAIGDLQSLGDRHVWRSTSNGATWEFPWEPLTQRPAAIALDSLGRIYVSTLNITVASSDDGGLTWHAMSAGLDSLALTSLAADRRGTIYGSNYRGVYAMSPAPSAVSDEREAGAAAIESIAPNPTSGTAMLHLHLDHASSLSVRLYDALGREALALPAMHLDPGAHAIPIDVARLSPGVYQCVITDDVGVRGMRMVVAR